VAGIARVFPGWILNFVVRITVRFP